MKKKSIQSRVWKIRMQYSIIMIIGGVPSKYVSTAKKIVMKKLLKALITSTTSSFLDLVRYFASRDDIGICLTCTIFPLASRVDVTVSATKASSLS